MGALLDLTRSKELLRRAKDVEHLAVLYERHPELAAGSDTEATDRLKAEAAPTGARYLSVRATSLNGGPRWAVDTTRWSTGID